MASRSVVATLVLDGVQGVVTGFKRVGAAAEGYAQVAHAAGTRAARWVDKNRQDLSSLGGSLLKVGAVGALALGATAKAAIDWESSWAGVTKTVDGSAEQMSRLESGLRGMAKELPASHKEIAAVAEAAGQLGVGVDDVKAFTKTMIDLGYTTNLSAEEASSSLAKFMNIMGTSKSEVGRLGSVTVALGNNFATTERDIVALSLRLAGVGKQMRISEASVMGMAAAMSSVGIEAEAGGTAMSMTVKKVDAAVRDGGADLNALAKIAGRTSEEFKKGWRDDAGETMAALVEGLGLIGATGGDVNKTLRELGVSGARESDTMIRLAGATKNAGNAQDILREALRMGGEAWVANTALADEAEKRYQTRSAQMSMTINRLKDVAISLGQALLPVVDSVLAVINSIAGGFDSLPAPAKGAAIAVGAVATAALLMIGGTLKAVAAIAALKGTLGKLGILSNATAALNGLKSSLASVGITAGVMKGALGIALTVAGLALAGWIGKQAEAKGRVDDLTASIQEQGKVISAQSRDLKIKELSEGSGILKSGDSFLRVAEDFGIATKTIVDATLGSSSAYQEFEEQANRAASAMERTRTERQKEMDGLRAKESLAGDEVRRLQELENVTSETWLTEKQRLDGLRSKVSESRGETDKATDAAKLAARARGEMSDGAVKTADAEQKLAGAMGTTTLSAEDQEKRFKALKESMSQAAAAQNELLNATQIYGNAMLEMSGSQMGVESAISGLNNALDSTLGKMKEGKRVGGEFTQEQIAQGKALDITTEAGRKNQESLNMVARSSMALVRTLVDQGKTSAEITAETNRAKEAWIKGATALGMNTEEAKKNAAALFAIPKDLTVAIAFDGGLLTEQQAIDINDALRDLPDTTKVEIVTAARRDGYDKAMELLEKAKSAQATAWINVRARVIGAAATMGGIGAIAALGNADGSVTDYYANGGLRERHVAQIAPAGSLRVWAEPETGGEAYIPLAPSKRSRSLAIWQETGRRLGVQGFAGGAVVGGSSSSVTYVTEVNNHLAPGAIVIPGLTAVAAVEDLQTRLQTTLTQKGGGRRG